ncbi:hypothetical protein BDK51DRAFT_52034 [Blyttiomyces helicus]|uniref:Calcineurin-like phosphoesterase domain-containing protein n=1 Tax=Blyttiomyces helicus TaxID=388810 RepID=A0A4P9WAB8_9FUNG|nr:hypothetical protein BDK51DRAFT_52034 [Blyttiomyces helicus]|eukprot:RKO89374.1 hypothetical protein BDK51DRAFT_52034 [Blyttiomyces helicus]
MRNPSLLLTPPPPAPVRLRPERKKDVLNAAAVSTPLSATPYPKVVLPVILTFADQLAMPEFHSAASFSFVHLTDFHFDKHIIPTGAVSELCHRASSSPSPLAPFGTLGCDAPKALADALFEYLRLHVAPQHPSFVLYTGDSARHDADAAVPRDAEEVFASAGIGR